MAFLGEITMIRRRYAAQTVNEDGDRVRGRSTDTPFRGSLQEVSGRDRQALREGDRLAEMRQVICERGFLRTVDQRNGFEADEVVCGDAIYVVANIRRDGHMLPHQAVTVIRRSEPR